MRTIEIKLYKFEELSQEAKDKATEDHYGINVEYWDWWDHIQDEAKELGLEVEKFHLDHRTINGKLTEDPHEVIRRIKANHGESCETYKTALHFETQLGLNQDIADEDSITQEFESTLLEDYLSMLRSEYEYLTSFETIEDTLRANGYDFTVDGTLY